MLISIQLDSFEKYFGFPEAIRLLGRVGFGAFDLSMYSIHHDDPFYGDGWREIAAGWRAASEEARIPCNQAHAPFPTYLPETAENASFNAHIFERIVRSMEAAAYMGAKQIVVHPIHNRDYAENREYLFDANMDFFRALAPYAKRFGIRVALENLYQYRDGHCVDSVCASPEEFARYLDTLADDCFTGCLDLGHCTLCGRRTEDVIRALGASRIGALHVHDNDGTADRHTAPWCGTMRWDEILQALADVRYEGDFTYETDGFFKPLPQVCLEDAARYLQRLAAYMVREIDGKRGAGT